MEKYLNKALSPKERAQDLLSRLSLEEKMAQVNCIMPQTFERQDPAAWVREHVKHGIGQVSCLAVRELKTLEEAARWQRQIQQAVMESSEHHIPAVFHMEGLTGAFLQGAMSFPSGIGRGSGWDPLLEKKIGSIVGRQEAACGITQVLAPVLDISRDSRMGRQGETYGEDPCLAAALGSAYTKGIQETVTDGRKPQSAAKHFLGFHNSQGGIHGANCDMGERLLDEVYGKPFQAAISEGGLKGIMPCYCSVNGEPLSASHRMLTELLREEMGFDGVCVSDYSAVGNVYTTQKVTESLEEAGLMCMEAGMDVELPDCAGFNPRLEEWFRDGKADIRVLDQAVLRVLTAKFQMGLFEHPFAPEGEKLNELFFEQTEEKERDREIALQSSLESMVLLKNNKVLPICKDVRKIAVIGCHGANARSFFGGYTHLSMVEAIYAVANSLAGVGASAAAEGKEMLTVPGTQIQCDETEEFEGILRWNKPGCKNLVEELRDKLPGTQILYAYGYPVAGDDTSHFEEALNTIKEADLVILTLGGKHGSCSVATMGEGVDGVDINLPYCQEEFIRQASALGKPMVGVHFNGRPISSDTADEKLDAILEAWNPSETGAEAIVKVLTGEYNPGGKLPVCVARCAGQIPVYYNHPNGSAWHQGESIGFKNYVDMEHTPRYFFGFGLSYTTFGYSDLEIDREENRETVKICVTVQNTGSVAGDEVVQLYIKDVQASMTRPVKELAGFQRVHLKPGEHKKVTFLVKDSQMAFLDRRMQWKAERGLMEVQVGSSSEDIRLTGSYMIEEDRIVDPRTRGFWAESVAK